MVAGRMYKGWEIRWKRRGWTATKDGEELGPFGMYDDLIQAINEKEGDA